MRRALVTMGFAALAASIASGEDAPPTTVTVAKEEVAFHVDLTGAFDAKDAVEVAFKPQLFTEEAEIAEARAPGPVAAGDVLVRFRTDKIDDAIRAADHELAVAQAAYAVQAEDFARQRELTAAGVAKAEFDAKNAADALRHFVEIEMPLRLEEADHGLQGTRNWITDQTEELAQLEKMYKSDDLTEETEDIVLKRARRDLDRTKRNLEFQTRRDKVMREIELPRERENLALEARRTAAERDKVLAVTRLQEAQGKLELDKAKSNLEKQTRDAAALAVDRLMYEVRAPVAGYPMPGILVRGKWQNSDEMAATLKKHGKVGVGTVLFTILPGGFRGGAGGWRVCATAPESVIGWIRVGQAARIESAIAGVGGCAAKVALGSLPYTSGAEYPVDFEPADNFEALIGTTCRIRIDTGKRTALLIPQTAVEDGGFDKWVHVLGADGKSSRRAVTLGQTREKNVEVTSGLNEGDAVLVTVPEK